MVRHHGRGVKEDNVYDREVMGDGVRVPLGLSVSETSWKSLSMTQVSTDCTQEEMVAVGKDHVQEWVLRSPVMMCGKWGCESGVEGLYESHCLSGSPRPGGTC